MSYSHRDSESLDELERRIVSSFKHVKNRNTKSITYPFKHHPWGPDNLKNKIYVVPLSDNAESLHVHFPIPEIRGQYKTGVSQNSAFSSWA